MLLIGWGLIYFGSVYEDDIIALTLKYLNNQFIGDWSGTLIMTLVNYIIPYALSIVGQLEKWDFASETLYADLWKNYYTTMLNIVFFMFLQGNNMV